MTIEERLVELLVPGVVTTLAAGAGEIGIATPYTVFSLVDQDPITTQQEALASDLRQWDFQFSSFAGTYKLARAQSQAILDFLTPFRDAGIRAVFLKPGSRRTMYEGDTKLHHSMIELHIKEALG